MNGDIYFISSDDDSENNFLNIEKILRNALGLQARKIPVLPLSLIFLSILLKFRGRSEVNLTRIYGAKKLLATNFIPVDTVHDAVTELGQSFLDNDNPEARKISRGKE